MSAATILLVDDDETLSRVLRRVLAQQGYTVVEAGDIAQALQAARDTPPAVGLLDLRLPDGDGVELARKLAESGARFPVILMTAYPLRLRDQPDLARHFSRVLTKPLNLQELRQAIDSALVNTHPPSGPARTPELAKSAPPERILSNDKQTQPTATAAPSWRRRVAIVAACLMVLALLITLPALGIVSIPDWHKSAESVVKQSGTNEPLSAKLADGDPDGLVLEAPVVKELNLTTAVLEAAAHTRPLRLSGFINYNPDYMQRVHALFGGEVIEIPEVEENVRGITERRKLSFNDHVRAGDLLAVVWSKDLGQMKNSLVDALVRLQFDEDTLTRYRTLSSTLAISESAVRTQQIAVSLDRNTADAAENALYVARVPPAEIKAVKEEAKKIIERHGEHDPATQKEWPRVEVRARFDGTLVEKNITIGDTVDTSFNTFLVADLSKLMVWANAYEEDLRELNLLALPHSWTVRLTTETKLVDRTESGPVLNSPMFEKITPAIDPNQHTATLMGRVDNSSGKLHVGQMVTVTIDLPQPGNTVAVPISAIDEDGEKSILFVQPDAGRPYYSKRVVSIVQRLSDVVLVSSRLTAEERKSGLQEINPGDRVVIQQAYVLRSTLDNLKSKKKAEASAPVARQ
jgi:CheY-like chemotaxis protein/multidrug efflux pump subunit AcrA (membrane-fusion protein)